jgi:transcriptional regulator with XRE-family HTH domain
MRALDNIDMGSIYVQFGLAIKKRRKAKRLSQEDLGELTQLGRATIAAIEGGRQTVALHQAKEISDALNTSIEQLIFDESEAMLEKHKDNLQEQDFRIVQQLMAK